MDTYFDRQVSELLDKAYHIIQAHRSSHHKIDRLAISFSEDFEKDFFRLVDTVNVGLMDDHDNFYGYFLLQMTREIRFDFNSPTAVNFRGANYIIYFNPILFLNLNRKQMESTIKHEILHILSLHLIRAKDLKGSHSTLAINMAMDIVINHYLTDLPPYATTLESVNRHYSLKLPPYASFEYYAEKLQTALDLLDPDDNGPINDLDKTEPANVEYDTSKLHELWDASDDIDDKTLLEFTDKAIKLSQKGNLPSYVNSMLDQLKSKEGELPWHRYLRLLMGTVTSNQRKTITRINRRQPERLDLKGQLRNYIANVIVAVDISASFRDEEFLQAMEEVIRIVRTFRHEITLLECDDEIRRTYKVNSIRDIHDRLPTRGATSFSPVIEFANRANTNLLVYFTDGRGEARLRVRPKGYKLLWVISGNGEELSLKEPYGAVKKLRQIITKADNIEPDDVPTGGFSMQHHEKM